MFTHGTAGRGRWIAALLALVAAAMLLTACGSDDGGDKAASTGSTTADNGGGAATGLKPINGGKLTVGMNLQFKPEMYLENGEPAGYDVDLLKELAPATGMELKIDNLDFNGLIPGLQSNKFDMVSVGLSPTEERRQVVDFTRGYVPYAQVLAVKQGKGASVTSVEQLDESGSRIVVLQGSTGEQLARRLFKKATVVGLPDQNAAFLELATGRAAGTIVEDYLLAQFVESNRNSIEQAAIGKPLEVQYGSWAVPKGNDEFVAFLDTWLCEKQEDGTLDRLYRKNFRVAETPPMPSC